MKSLISGSLSQSFISLFILQVGNYIFPLLTWPILSNYLGIHQFGILMLLLSVCAMSNIVTDFGFNLSATHSISKNRSNQTFICNLLSNVFLSKTLLALLVSISVLLYFSIEKANHTQNIDDISVLLLVLIIFFQSWQCPWFFQGIERMKHIARIVIISRVIYLFSIVSLLPYFSTINTALFCFLLNQIFISLSYIYYIHKENFKFGKLNLREMFNELKYSSNFFISRVAVSLYTTGNVLVLGYFHSAQVVGLYASAEKLYNAGTGIASIVSQAMYPYTTRTGNLKLLVKLILIIFIPFSIGCYIVSFFSSEIMALIFGNDFFEGGMLLNYFLLLMCITFLSVSIGYPGFAAINKVYLANYTVVIGSIVHILGILYLYLTQNIYPITVLQLVLVTESVILFLRISLLFYYKDKEKL